MAALLADLAAGRPPQPTGAVDVHPQPPGRSAAVLAFTARHIVAAEVAPGWVQERLDPEDVGAPMKSAFLVALGDLLRRRPGALDVLLVAAGRAGEPPLELTPWAEDHPRLARARRYRSDLRAHAVPSAPGAVVLVGRGFAGRWEVAFDVPDAERGRGLGQALAAAARHLVPSGEPVWAQVSPGNAASLRAVLAAGYRPVGAEVLFVPDSE